MDKIKLKWKLFVMLLLFCAFLLIILWMFQTVFLDVFYRNIRVLQIKRDAALIAENIGDDGLEEYIAGLAQDGVTVDIADRDGVSILASPDEDESRGNGLGQERNRVIISRLESQSFENEFYEYIEVPLPQSPLPQTSQDRFSQNHSPSESSFRRNFPIGRSPSQSLVYARFADTGEDRLYIVVRAVISPVNATVMTLRYQLYIISGVMFVLSVTLAIIMAKRVSKPIEVINISAAKLAKGDYDVRFSGKGFAEIVGLSDTLNAAAVELGKVEGLRRELMANVSHDLRTPLALIYSYAEMMRDFPNEITPEQPETIMDEAKRLTSLVNDVLDISKLENGMESLNITNFCLTSCVEDTVKRMNELLVSEGYTITFDHGGEAWVKADKSKIDRAFYNLLINAVNYTGESKKVLVKQMLAADKVRISVTDSGEGIPPEDLPAIWDRYYKSKKSHKRGVTGTGLGLSIVKKIIEQHGGRYGVESELGHGSTFWIELDYQRIIHNPSLSQSNMPPALF